MNHRNNLERIENIHTDALEARGFTVYQGWNDDLAEELVEVSKQPHIVASTPGDIQRRFHTLQMANAWHNEGRRSVYTLRGESLAGLIWYDVRPRADVNASHTFAIRMYEEAQGKKLAHGFMQAAHHGFVEHKGNQTVWLDVANDNPAARHLYDKFGYEATHDEGDRTVMVYRRHK